VAGIPITEFIASDRLDEIVHRTKKGGGELVGLMGTSAWYAPGAAAAQMVEAIVKDENRIFPCCVKLDGQYGLKDVYLGVPVALNRSGVGKIIEVNLNAGEMQMLHTSASHVKDVMNTFDGMGII